MLCPDIPTSFRAWVGEVDGVPRGIAGIAYTRPLPSVFLRFEEEYRPYLKRMPVLRLIMKVRRILDEEVNVPVVALSDPNEGTKLLDRLGFVMTCHGPVGTLYRKEPRQ